MNVSRVNLIVLYYLTWHMFFVKRNIMGKWAKQVLFILPFIPFQKNYLNYLQTNVQFCNLNFVKDLEIVLNWPEKNIATAWYYVTFDLQCFVPFAKKKTASECSTCIFKTMIFQIAFALERGEIAPSASFLFLFFFLIFKYRGHVLFMHSATFKVF